MVSSPLGYTIHVHVCTYTRYVSILYQYHKFQGPPPLLASRCHLVCSCRASLLWLFRTVVTSWCELWWKEVVRLVTFVIVILPSIELRRLTGSHALHSASCRSGPHGRTLPPFDHRMGGTLGSDRRTGRRMTLRETSHSLACRALVVTVRIAPGLRRPGFRALSRCHGAWTSTRSLTSVQGIVLVPLTEFASWAQACHGASSADQIHFCDDVIRPRALSTL